MSKKSVSRKPVSRKPASTKPVSRKPASKRIVIDINGGVLQAVFSDIPGLQILLVDWDNIRVGDTAGEVPYSGLSGMPEDTVRALRNHGLI
jgi:hypothetical protein